MALPVPVRHQCAPYPPASPRLAGAGDRGRDAPAAPVASRFSRGRFWDVVAASPDPRRAPAALPRCLPRASVRGRGGGGGGGVAQKKQRGEYDLREEMLRVAESG